MCINIIFYNLLTLTNDATRINNKYPKINATKRHLIKKIAEIKNQQKLAKKTYHKDLRKRKVETFFRAQRHK